MRDCKSRTTDAHNNVAKSSKGKWEDGIYEMLDKTSPHKHGNKEDTPNGAYGEDGIFRAKSFKETLKDIIREGMGVHAGREKKTFKDRITMGCIRTTASAMKAIMKAIKDYGALQKLIIQDNRQSENSDEVNRISPSNKIL